MKRELFLSAAVLTYFLAVAQAQESRPVAGETYTVVYKPGLTGILQGAKQISMVCAFDYWGTTAHQVQHGESGDSVLFDNVLNPDSGKASRILMKKEGKVWRADISIPGDAALLSYYFTDGLRYDFNEKKTYVSYVYDKKGKPVRNARLRNVDFLLMAGKSTRDAIDEVHRELTDYPDNFLAQIVYWRFQIFNTASPDTLNMLASNLESYYDSLRSQYGDTVLYCRALGLFDIDRVVMLSLSDSIGIEKPEAAGLTRSVNAALSRTVAEIPVERRSGRIKQIDSWLNYALLPPERRKELLQQRMERMKEMSAEFVGRQAPDFSFETVKGEKHRLSDFRGKYVLLDFWGTWCGPCVGEIPNLVKAYQKYKDKGLVVISISSDSFGPERLADYTEQKGMRWMQVLDGKPGQGPIQNLFAIQFYPNPFLIDKDGKVLQREGLRGEELDKTLSGLLGK